MGLELRTREKFTDWLAKRIWKPFHKEAEALKWKDALRAALGVALFAIAAVIFDYQDRLEEGRRDMHQWSQGCLWGAITIVTVNSPVMGKIAKTSFERCLGTILGGWLGCACFLVTRHPAWTAVISFLFVMAASLLAVKLKLDYSCKLLAITFVLVLWTPQSDRQAVTVAASRVTCIVLAVLLMALLAMLIYPQIASEQVLGSLNKAMESTAALNRIVWEEVIVKCREESFRITTSFRLRRDSERKLPVASTHACSTADSSSDPEKSNAHQPEPAIAPAAASQHLEAAPVTGSREVADHDSAHGTPDGSDSPQDGTAASLAATCNGGTVAQPQAAGGASKSEEPLRTVQQTGQHIYSGRQPTDSHTCSTYRAQPSKPQSPFHPSQSAGAAARKGRAMRGCLPVCCARPPKEANTNEEAKKQLDAEEKAAANEAALRLGFKGYAELEREEPFFDASTAVRNQQAAAEEQLTTALSEMYVGTWAGRRWYLPTIFYHNQAHDKHRWHMPEKTITRLAMRMRRVVRVLNMIHATFRDGFQKEVLEELEHHFPLDLLVQLSEAAMNALQAFVDAFPKPGRPVTAEMPDDGLKQLREVADTLLSLAQTSRQRKVALILLGEEVRKAVAADGCTEAQLHARLWAAAAADGALSQPAEGVDELDLFLFPNTESGWLATVRWYSFHFLVQQLVDALGRLRVTLNLLLPRLPGAHIEPSVHDAGDIGPTPSETAEHSVAQERRSKLQVVLEA